MPDIQRALFYLIDCMKRFGIYIYILFFTAAALFAGCELLDEPQANNQMEVKLFARMGVHLHVKSATKGAITSTTDSVLKLGVLRLDTENPYFVNCATTPLTASLGQPNSNEGNLRTVTEFSTSQFFANNESKVTYAAWYPWPVPDGNNGLEAGVPTGYAYSTSAENTQVTFPITGDSDIMYSSVVSGTKQSGFDVMQFNHALCMFRIHVYKSTDLDWGNLESVTLNEVPDKCVITLPKSEQAKTHKIDYILQQNDGKGINLSLSCNEAIPVGFENKKIIKEWIAAPSPVQKSELKQLLISVKASEYELKNIAIARDFKPGYIYDIVLRFSDKGVIDAQVEINDWVEGEDVNSSVGSSGIFYNLSAYGKANCYIVSAANYGYSIDVTVKGNGNTDAMPGNNISTSLDPKYVDVVWAEGVTWSNGVTSTATNGQLPDFALETRKVVEGKVLFKLNGNSGNTTDKSLRAEGNVLLGVYDKDYDQQDRKCLWTWHIWITDKPQDQNYMNGYIALDRNLGAIAPAPENGSAEGMNGLFYQWGRPTPFHLITNNVNKTVDATNSYTRVTPDFAVANPGIFYGRFNTTTDGAQSEVDAPSESDDYHDWIDRTQFSYVNNLWGYREEEHEKPVKTIYDPCPHGYHVPYARTWEKLDGFDNNMPDDRVNGVWPPDNGVRLTIEGSDIWYPYQGFINKDGVYKSGHIHLEGSEAHYSDVKIVEMWSALINRHDADDIAGNLTGESEKINDSPYRFMFNKDDQAKLSDEYTNRSRGLAVRCVSNNTADVVKDLSAYQTSNCYMVHEDGYYKFKATVRGNGVGSLLPLGGTTTAEINGGLSTTISPVRVDILWWQGDFTKAEDFVQTNNGAKPANMCLSLLDNGVLCDDGYVSFQISGFSKGNVVLAAYDEIGTILWTWHIWLTDKPVDKLSGNYTKMDRFLGATFAPEIPATPDEYISWNSGEIEATLGFYYQWGRKDPIIGPPGFEDVDDEGATAAGESVASSGWWMHSNDTWSYGQTIPTASAASIPDVVKNPTAFYKSASYSGSSDSQWFPPQFADGYTNVALWGYAVKDYSIQGQTFSKTMHDPCPPGYRTPFHHSWYYNGNEKYALGEDGGGVWPYTWPGDKIYGWENSYEYRGIVTNKEHFEKMWFPFVGYRNPLTGGYENVGEEGRMNTGMPMRQYETRTFWYNANNSGQDAGGRGSAYGMMVRCMKE